MYVPLFTRQHVKNINLHQYVYFISVFTATRLQIKAPCKNCQHHCDNLVKYCHLTENTKLRQNRESCRRILIPENQTSQAPHSCAKKFD